MGKKHQAPHSLLEVLLYWPNIMCYVRFFLCCIALLYFQHPVVFTTLYILSWILDSLDGTVARMLNQTSEFGAWLDIVLDIFARSSLWCGLYPRFGCVVSSVEWLCFVCTHNLGGKWKSFHRSQPSVVHMVMKNGCRTTAGIYALGSIWGLPIFLYLTRMYTGPLLPSEHIITLLGTLLIGGRILGLVCEAWYIYDRVITLLMQSIDYEEDYLD